MYKLATIALALFALDGCAGTHVTPGVDGSAGSDGGTSLSGLVSIDVTPANATTVVTNGTPGAPVTFTAMGHFSDNHVADITADVEWTIADTTLGTLTANSFAPVADRGGKSTITATSDTITGTAQVLVTWTSSRISTADDSTATTAASGLFTSVSGSDPTLAPNLVYPPDGATMPNNLGELEVQWQKPAGAADLFEVKLTGEGFDLRLYTNAPETVGGRISLLPAEWTALAATLAGEKVNVVVSGLSTSDSSKSGVSSSAGVMLDAQPLQGGIYYWTPTNQGIERHSFADTTTKAVDFYSAPDAAGHCVACHVLSHDGKKAVVSFDSSATSSALIDVATRKQLIPLSTTVHFDFAAFSPDSNTLIAAHQTGTLSLFDTSGDANTTGVALPGFDIAPPAGMWNTQVDWSADGKSIVFIQAQATNVQADWAFTGGSIIVMTGPGDGTFANPVTLVQSMGETNYYPSFSPDGKWILFNRAPSGQSYNNPLAEVDVISADGSSGVITLAAANASGEITNSWPRWAPFVQKYPDGSSRMYFTFSSVRNYGIELIEPAATGPRPQIWMSAFSPAAAMAKTDPSSAAFWLPFQDITTNNHIAQWTTTIIATID